MNMDAIIEKFLQYPNLPILLTELNQFIAEEDRQRESYHNSILRSGKTEFINGRTIIYPRNSYKSISVLERLFHLLRSFSVIQNEGEVLRDIPVSLSRNSYQPAIVYYKTETTKTFTDNQVLFPSPDLIVELTNFEMEKNMREIKFTDYTLHSVQEYWLINPEQQSIEQYLLRDNNYELNIKSNSGFITSKVLTGFTIKVEAVFNEAENLNALQQILL